MPSPTRELPSLTTDEPRNDGRKVAEATARAIFTSEAAVATFVRYYEPVLGHARYRDRRSALGPRGLLLLSPGERERMMSLKVKAARADPALCAGFWNGDAAKANILGALEKWLSPAELEDWLRLDSQASLRALNDEPRATAPASDDVSGALRAVDGTLSPAKSAAFRRTLAVAEGAPGAEGCEAYLTIANAASKLAEPYHELLTRFVLSPETLTH